MDGKWQVLETYTQARLSIVLIQARDAKILEQANAFTIKKKMTGMGATLWAEPNRISISKDREDEEKFPGKVSGWFLPIKLVVLYLNFNCIISYAHLTFHGRFCSLTYSFPASNGNHFL